MEIKMNSFHTRYFSKKLIEVTQSCLTLCNPMDCSLLSSSVHGIFQARVLECVAIFFSMAGRFLTTEPLGKSQNSFLKYKHVLCDIWDIIILEKSLSGIQV